MAVKVFIDGKDGTTGLKIYERMQKRDDIELLLIDEDKRKDTEERKKLINESDYTFLCLPDAAAIEAVTLCENPDTKIIDSSTAHRTSKGWDYGFPELSPTFRENIKKSKRVAVPGCYASGFTALMYPLVKKEMMPQYFPVNCTAISGYSGAGKKGINAYENAKTDEMNSPKIYALEQNHKHVKEMKAISQLSYKPMFIPIVDDYFNGMAVTIPIQLRTLNRKTTTEKIWEFYNDYYKNEHFVKVMPFKNEEELKGTGLYTNTLKDTNQMELYVCGNHEQTLLITRFDNLGKGASGAAMQCMNIMMGIDEKTGLE